MPEILGITNPVPGHDINNNNRSIPLPPGSTQLQNVPGAARVGRADGRAEKQDSAAQSQSQVRYDSNFQAFLQRLKGTPDLTQTLTRLLSGRTGTVVSSGVREGIAAELSQLVGMLSMDQGQLLKFLASQYSAGTRFSGPLFSLLLKAYRQTGGESARGDILQFLKAYGDFSSTGHIEGNLLRNLGRMVRSIPASFGSRLAEMLAQLENGVAAGDRSGNLKLLQGKIVPFMSEYVARTHDLGRARGFFTLLTLDITRYENGSEENLLQAFQQLKNHAHLKDKLGGLDDDMLLALLKNTAFAKAEAEDPFVQLLLQAARQGLRGEGGPDTQNAFRELISAFLVNESVYMPLNHLMIPLEWEGKMMYSEIWVDPDAGREQAGDSAEERSLRFLFKFDIQSLGFFDLVLTCRGSAVDVRLHCPSQLAPFSAVIEKGLGRILADNGFQKAQIQVREMVEPLTVSEVFPQIFHGKDSVNVTV